MQNDKNYSKCSNIFIWICVLLSPTACMYVWKIMHIYAHTLESIIKFCDTRGWKRPPWNICSQPGLDAPQNSLVPWFFLIFLVSVQIGSPQSNHLHWPPCHFRSFPPPPLLYCIWFLFTLFVVHITTISNSLVYSFIWRLSVFPPNNASWAQKPCLGDKRKGISNT